MEVIYRTIININTGFHFWSETRIGTRKEIHEYITSLRLQFPSARISYDDLKPAKV